MPSVPITSLNVDFRGACTDLSFDCPVCGPPHRVWIAVTFGEPSEGRWQVSSTNGWANFDGFCVTPSIHNHYHNRKHPACGFHGEIKNGIVTWP